MRCIDVWKKEKGSCAGLRCDAKAEENLVWRQVRTPGQNDTLTVGNPTP